MDALPHRTWWRLALIAWLALGVAAAVAWTAYSSAHEALARMSPDVAAVNAARAALVTHHDGPINVLLLGSDRRMDQPELGARSDTMILARLDPAAGALTLLSIPRDLQVQVPGLGREKINAAYAQAGPAGAIGAVRETLGVPVHHYLDVNFQGFFGLVQHLGGVWVQVDRRYYNPEGTGWAPIDLRPGYQRLNGNQALQFVRFRHTDTDFTRSARQQLVLQNVKAQAAGRLGLADLPDLINIAGDNLRTDVRDVAVLGGLLEAALAVDPGRIRRVRFGGVEGPSVVTADAEAISRTRREFLQPPPADVAVTAPRPPVVVANAGAGLGAAERAAQMLRRDGWEAHGMGDAARAGVAWRPGIYGRSADDRRVLAGLAGRLDLPLRPITGTSAHRAVIILGPDQAATDGSAAAGSGLVPTNSVRTAARDAGCAVAPRALPPGASLSESEGIRRYAISDADGSHRACAITVFDPAAGGWWQVQQVNVADPPILRGTRPAGSGAGGRQYRAISAAGKMRLIAWEIPGGWAYIHNTLESGLSPTQMRAIADATRAA